MKRYQEAILDILTAVVGFLAAVVLPIVYLWVNW